MKRLIIAILLLFCSAWAANAASVMQSAPDSLSAERIISTAKKYIGTPYKWGGKGPYAFDCSGFTRFVFGQFGISLAPSAPPQFKQGKPVSTEELRPGDLVFFGGRKASRSIGHVGLVTEVDPVGKTFHFIHASRSGVRISSSTEGYYVSRYICACRVLPNYALDNVQPQYSKDGKFVLAQDEETAFDLYALDSSTVFSYLAGEDLQEWMQTNRNKDGWIDLIPCDTVLIHLSDNGHPELYGEHFSTASNEQDGVAYAYCHFDFATHCGTDDSYIKSIIQPLRDSVDILIVTFESNSESLLQAQWFAYQCIDLGADIVCCYGDDLLPSLELYDNHLITHALGSTITPRLSKNDKGKTGIDLQLRDSGTLIDGQIFPAPKAKPQLKYLQMPYQGYFLPIRK